MSKEKKMWIALGLLSAFVLWTLAVSFVDVQSIGPLESSVGFATVNGYFHRLTGVHMDLYTVTDWLGLVPVAFGMGFALVGLVQWVRRKGFLKVDGSILVLGAYYLAVLALYLLFEEVVINRRPILIDGYLEASYPSSTTMLVLCVMPTARMQLRNRIKNKGFRRGVSVAMDLFVAFMVIGRLISGVHWLTDIIGGILLGAGLVMLYGAVCGLVSKQTER